MWGNSILHGHKCTGKSFPKKITLNNKMLATIKLLYIKSPNFTRFVAVKVITLARHLQNHLILCLCVCLHTHMPPCAVEVHRHCDAELELVLSHWVSPWGLTEVVRLHSKHLYTLSSHEPLSALNATKMRSLKPNLLDTTYPNISGGVVFFAKFQKYCF